MLTYYLDRFRRRQY